MPNQSISRYVFAGLAFVLFFVGIAYIAYRFSNRADDTALTTPSPTPSVVSQAPATIDQRVVLPPPPSQWATTYLPTGVANSRKASRSFIASAPAVKADVTDPNLIVLKREELAAKSQLDLEMLQADTRITLAKIEADLEKTRLTLQKELQHNSQSAAAASQQRILALEQYKITTQYDLARRQLELRASPHNTQTLSLY